MAGDHIRIETNGSVRFLIIDRPGARNAMTPAMLERFISEVRGADADHDLRALVVRGAEAGPFSAGYDLGAVPSDGAATAESARNLQKPVRDVCDALRACRHPVVGAARGYAIGAAFDIFAHCDLRVAEDGARFSLPAARLGFGYPAEGVARLIHTMGASSATEFLLLARQTSAEELRQAGFLHRVFACDTFDRDLEMLVEEIGALAPLALRSLKQAITESEAAMRPHEAAIARSYEAMAATLNTADSREGPAAVREKRAPVFIGA